MASTCCEIGLWSPIIAARISREHLGCRSSGLEIGGRNTGTPRRLAVTHGLVSARKVLGSVVVGSIGRRSGAPWQQVVYRASASKRSDGLKMFQSARGVRSYSGLPQRLGSFSLDFSSLEVASEDVIDDVRLPALTAALSAFSFYPGIANASTLNPAYGDVGAFLEAGVQLIYLGALLVLLGVGSFLVVRQVLIKRELETAAKDLQDRVRSGEASSLEFFELGAVMLRKKYFQLANKYLDQAIKKWDGSEQDLAQVYNALGFSYFSDGKVEKAIAQYEKAVQLQPGYVTAWNNLADAYENQKDFAKALTAYEQALQFDPTNKVASARRDFMKSKVDRFQGIP